MSTKAIYTGHGFVTETDSVQYVQLSDFATLLSGVSVAAASAGTKNLRPGKHYILPAAGLTNLSVEKRLAATLAGSTQASLTSLHDGKAQFAASLSARTTIARASLSTNFSVAQTPTYRATGTSGIANNGNVTPGQPTKSAGDLLLAVGLVRHAGSLSASAGWNAITLTRIGSGLGFPAAFAWWRTATNDASDALTMTLTGGSAGDTVIGVIHSFYNYNTTTPVDNGTWEDPLFTASDPFRHPSSGTITIDDNDRLFIYWGGNDDATTIGTPTITSGGVNSADEAAFSFTLHNNITTNTGSDATLATASAANPRDYQIAFQADIAWQDTSAVDETWGTIVINGTVATPHAVHFAGTLAAESAASLALAVTSNHKFLDGTLSAVSTATLAALAAGPAKFCAGTLAAESAATLNLFVGPDKAMAGTLAGVTAATLSTLATGTRQARLTWVELRFPLPRNDRDLAGTLTSTASATATLMATGERHLASNMEVAASAYCDLRVGRLAGTLSSHASALLWRLTTGDVIQPAALLQARSSALASLFVGGLKGSAAARWTATMWLNRIGQKNLAGTASVTNTAYYDLHIERSLWAQMASLTATNATLTVGRGIGGTAGVNASAQLSLTSDKHIVLAIATTCQVTLGLQIRPKLTALLGCSTATSMALDTDPGLRAVLVASATAAAQLAAARQLAADLISRASARCALSTYRPPDSVTGEMYVTSRIVQISAGTLDKGTSSTAISVERDQYETA